MSLRDDMYDPEYPVLEKGDVAYISNAGNGLTEKNKGLYCVIEEYNPTGYYGSAGYRVSKYEHDLVNHDYEKDWVSIRTFGENPLVLFNINDEHVVDPEHVAVANGSKEEVDGASGLMTAYMAAQRGRKVLVLEKANKVGKKILMSGGGKCNFTNLEVEPNHYISHNPHFVISALTRYTNWDVL